MMPKSYTKKYAVGLRIDKQSILSLTYPKRRTGYSGSRLDELHVRVLNRR
jgi:hypothetical protein